MIIRKVSLLFVRLAAIPALLLALNPRDTRATALLFQAAPFVPIPNLVAYWDADNDVGTTATDSSGNNNTGTYMAGANTSTTVQGVPTGNTRSFNFVQASNQYIRVPDSPSISLTGAFTLAAWVRRTNDSTVQQGIIEKYDDSPAIGHGYSLRLSAAEHFSFSVYSGTTQKEISTTGSATPFRGADLNTWNHVAAVFNPASSPHMAIYKNSTKDATDSANTAQEPVGAPTDGSQQLQIGKDYGANAFQGNIDEVRIYNRALTQPEVAILRNGQPPATGVSAVADIDSAIVSWTGAAGATTYVIQRATAPGGPWTNAGTSASSSFTDTGATFPGTYYFRVIAVSVMASTPAGPAGPVTPLSPIPPPPRTKDHEEGLFDQKCACNSIPASGVGLWGALAAVLAVIGLLVRR